jgi:hypothetical protein
MGGHPEVCRSPERGRSARQLASFLHTGAVALLTGKQLSLTSNSITVKLEAK